MVNDVDVGNRRYSNAQRPTTVFGPKTIDRTANANPVFVVTVRHSFVDFVERTTTITEPEPRNLPSGQPGESGFGAWSCSAFYFCSGRIFATLCMRLPTSSLFEFLLSVSHFIIVLSVNVNLEILDT